MAAAAAPRRGERGFAPAQRARGGDPRLQEARQRRLRAVGTPEDPGAVETAPEPATGQRRGVRERAAGYNRASERAGQATVTPMILPAVPRVTVEDGASLVLGVFAWVLTMQYLRGGAPQVKRFLRAKFLNQTGGSK